MNESNLGLHRVISSLVSSIVIAATLTGCAPSSTLDHVEVWSTLETESDIREKFGVYADEALQTYVQRVGEKISAYADWPAPFHFTVTDSTQIDAFSIGGGYIFISRGLLAYLNSEAELAAILGHEVGHVTARHRRARSLRNLPAATRQSQEYEADRLGLQYLARAGYDPSSALSAFTVLNNREEADKKTAEIERRKAPENDYTYASHPSTDARISALAKEIEKLDRGGETHTGREDYLKYISNLTFGDHTERGVRRRFAYYSSELDFAVNFPFGWTLEHSSRKVEAQSGDDDAYMNLSWEEIEKDASPKNYLKKIANTKISDEGPLTDCKLPSYSALVPYTDSGKKKNYRMVVLVKDGRAFTLIGVAEKQDRFKAVVDNLTLATARTFRALGKSEKELARKNVHLKLYTARAGDTFAALARSSPIDDYAELTLRLLNHKFPAGEPAVGEVIKIVQ